MGKINDFLQKKLFKVAIIVLLIKTINDILCFIMLKQSDLILIKILLYSFEFWLVIEGLSLLFSLIVEYLKTYTHFFSAY